jgi:hypothetical protein
MDTGARANEFLNIDLDDINQAIGDICKIRSKAHSDSGVKRTAVPELSAQ